MSNLDIDRGYELPDNLKDSVYKYQHINIPYGISLFAVDHILIWVPCFIIFSYFPDSYWLYPLAWIVAIRSMRGLECLVHETSHYNVLRDKKSGDVFGNFFAALPVFSTVEHYRNSHSKHHSFFGTNDDPDKPRHEELNLAGLDRENIIKFFLQVLRRIPKYVPGWWKAIGTTWKISSISILWHMMLVIMPMSFIMGLEKAFLYWVLSFLIPFLLFLPILRLIGEAGEHDYSSKLSVAVGTYTNTGIINKALLYPHGDGFHTLHHLYAFIPHYSLSKVHEILNKNDSDNWHSHLRERKSIFQNV